jgi:hypothetical protein
MTRFLAAPLAAFVLSLAACEPADPCPGKEICGSGCMPTGASCCPDGEHYCDGGYSCGTDNLCHAGGGGTCPVNTCINNLCSPGLWCCTTACSGCGCQ